MIVRDLSVVCKRANVTRVFLGACHGGRKNKKKRGRLLAEPCVSEDNDVYPQAS